MLKVYLVNGLIYRELNVDIPEISKLVSIVLGDETKSFNGYIKKARYFRECLNSTQVKLLFDMAKSKNDFLKQSGFIELLLVLKKLIGHNFYTNNYCHVFVE